MTIKKGVASNSLKNGIPKLELGNEKNLKHFQSKHFQLKHFQLKHFQFQRYFVI